jgi:hypothetical protein
MAANDSSETGYSAFYLRIWIGAPSIGPIDPDRFDLAEAMKEVHSACFGNGVQMKVSREGYFILDFSKHPTAAPGEAAKWDRIIAARVRFMNLFIACLHTEAHGTLTIPPTFIDRSTMMAPREWSLQPLHAFSSTGKHDFLLGTRRLSGRMTIPIERVIAAIDATDKALTVGNDVDLLAEMLLQTLSYREAGQLESALLTAWNVAERCLNHLWQQYITRQERDVGLRINEDRRKTLRGVAFSASVMAENLSLAGVLSNDDYQALTAVRQKRNAWVHKLQSIELTDANAATSIAQKMLFVASGIDVRLTSSPFESIPMSFKADGRTSLATCASVRGRAQNGLECDGR